MNDKRKYTRYASKIKCKFIYFEGNPETIDPEKDPQLKGKGLIIDISQGGIFIVSNARVTVGIPTIVHFKIPGSKEAKQGRVVRTGLLENNPSEVAQHFSIFSSKGETYIAVEFDEPLPELDNEKL